MWYFQNIITNIISINVSSACFFVKQLVKNYWFVDPWLGAFAKRALSEELTWLCRNSLKLSAESHFWTLYILLLSRVSLIPTWKYLGFEGRCVIHPSSLRKITRWLYEDKGRGCKFSSFLKTRIWYTVNLWIPCKGVLVLQFLHLDVEPHSKETLRIAKHGTLNQDALCKGLSSPKQIDDGPPPEDLP